MIPTNPYLIRAIYDWCADQDFTPHLLVDTSQPEVVVPQHLVENDSIVLNIQANAVKGLELGNEWIVFNARFSGQPMDISVPIAAVRAIFAKENGLGCAFEVTEELTPQEVEDAMDEISAELQSAAKQGRAKQSSKNRKIAKKSIGKKPNLKLVD